MFSQEGREELLLSIDSASLASMETSAINLMKSHFIIKNSDDTYWERLRSPIWSLAMTDNRFDPHGSSLSFLISVENFNREFAMLPRKSLLLRSEKFGLNQDTADYISGFIYVFFVKNAF